MRFYAQLGGEGGRKLVSDHIKEGRTVGASGLVDLDWSELQLAPLAIRVHAYLEQTGVKQVSDQVKEGRTAGACNNK